MRNLVAAFPENKLMKEAVKLFVSSGNVVYSGANNSSSKSFLLAEILKTSKKKGNFLWVSSDNNELKNVYKSLKKWTDKPVFLYEEISDGDVLKYGSLSEFKRIKNLKKIEFITRISVQQEAFFLINFESLLQNFPEIKSVKKEKMTLKGGDNFDIVEFIQSLVAKGYEVTDHDYVQKGQYFRKGDSFYIHPINSEEVLRIDFEFEKIEKIVELDELNYAEEIKEKKSLEIYPIKFSVESSDLVSLFEGDGVIVDDEVEVVDEFYDVWNAFMNEANENCRSISFSAFNDDVDHHYHLHFNSLLKYRNAYDFANDLRDKIAQDWNVLVFTKKKDVVRGLFADQKIPFIEGLNPKNFDKSSIFLLEVEKEDTFPDSFQNSSSKLMICSDSDLSFLREKKKKVASSSDASVFADFLMGLKKGDYVVHVDHGIAKFLGLDKKTVDGITKEYLKLGYLANDKLFVPIDQADKVNKYIGSEEHMPKLTRLGSSEWNTVTSKVKKETQKIAKELLKLYAERKAAKGHKFPADNNEQILFEETFPYEETPGQIKAINDVKKDMESTGVMDRLVVGDVGFGKTEVAMRATFKAVKAGKQVAVISPITILADQHYKSFKKRMGEFNVRIDMLSRFRKASEQKKIVERLSKGELDVIVGTHRLLQKDIKFKNLGLVVIDEEQRFGVKQKETLKEMRKEVDMLTLTATPIPRTLNICLNKLRDVTTITTPPFGRLPVITEVRKYSSSLVREVILREKERGGQVYFLHNRVQTIDGFAERLSNLIPEAKFVVAHGKLGAGDLEERILDFKEGKYDVLVSSTIIENGIDLPNANTLIVDSAERFGLAQLYQLRGRVGRGKAQAYAYFLYNGQRLKLDAKKRLRAIVEASNLGSGFQIAMKDLEIRGAGDILGVNQHGVINVVGVAHFIRMLNKAVEDLKAGRVIEGEENVSDVSIEIPIPAFIPDDYIVSSNDKINFYQKLSSADTKNYLNEIKSDLVEDYGKMPRELNNLIRIIELKIEAKKAGLLSITTEVVPMSKKKEVVLQMSKNVKPGNIASLLMHNEKWRITGSRLRININDLGKEWFEGVFASVKALGKRIEAGKK